MTDEEKTVHKMTVEQTMEQTVEQWLAIRKQAGLQIDPETAEVEWTYALTLDPYGVEPVPEEPVCRAGVLRPFSWKRRVGLVWRSARRHPRRLMGKAQFKVGVSGRIRGDAVLGIRDRVLLA